MSATTLARWNAIPLSRADSDSQQNNLKRSRPDDEDDDDIKVDQDPDDDDDVSILSRSPSPSPPPPDAMDIDKYDEYIKGAAREVITVETKIKPTNKGFTMLSKLGWSDGQPLGLSGDGRVEPIPFQIKRDLTGLGKLNQELRLIEAAVSQRRELDSERQQKETEVQRQAREDNVARRVALQTEISSTLKAFYCELCDKQFKMVAQYDEHTNSYAHHHKARFREMQASQRMKPQGEVDKRKEKERKREEKELRKIAAAAGVRMAKPPVQLAPTLPSNASMDPVSTNMEVTSSFKKSGWATLGGGTSSSAQSVPEPPPVAGTSSQSVPSPPIAPPAPTFRSASWTSLDTGSCQPVPPPSKEIPIAPTAGVSQGGWSAVGSSQTRGTGGRNLAATAPTIASVEEQLQPLSDNPPSTGASQSRVRNIVDAHHLLNNQTLRPHPIPSNQNRPPSPPSTRSGWQQFKQKGPKRR